MAARVLIHNQQDAVPVPGRYLRAAIRRTLAREGRRDPVEVSLALVEDEAMRALNRRYRRRDRSTDVLAFSQEEGPAVPEAPAGGAARLLGDVVIATPTALRQAARAGHPVDRELAFLAVHGVLHLLGHDDDTPAKARAMRRLGNAILDALREDAS